MGLRSSIILISLAPLLFAGCGKSNYMLKSQTPEDLNGFLGFRWTTPIDIVEEQMIGTSDAAESRPDLNDFYTLSYTNIFFMQKKARLSQFIFDKKGLSAAKLTFKTTAAYSESDFDNFRDKLAMIYGIPVHMTRPAYQKEYLDYINGYYWFNGRLVLTLMPGGRIIINAFRDECRPPDATPPQPPITNTQSIS